MAFSCLTVFVQASTNFATQPRAYVGFGLELDRTHLFTSGEWGCFLVIGPKLASGHIQIANEKNTMCICR